ncbi:GntR family transcriptional regulator [Nonomuraea sp. NPDC005650]|uniref:GntR family transcriptional regulator n=1 Tax=Nonomuraea sp. NPDC005650 TaxID=3157045 RepID=UPI0033BB0FE7
MRYLEIAAALRDRIDSGQYAPGDQLPSEAELRQEFDGASANTVRQALAVLTNEGLTRSERGRGVFVRSYDRTPVDVGPAGGEREFGAEVEVQIMRTPAHLADLLPGVARVVRRRALGGALRASYYPRELADVVPELAEPEPLPELDHVLLTRAGAGVSEGQTDVVARMPTPQEAAALALPPATPVLEYLATLVDADGAVRVVREALYAGDRHKLRMRLR